MRSQGTSRRISDARMLRGPSAVVLIPAPGGDTFLTHPFSGPISRPHRENPMEYRCRPGGCQENGSLTFAREFGYLGFPRDEAVTDDPKGLPTPVERGPVLGARPQ